MDIVITIASGQWGGRAYTYPVGYLEPEAAGSHYISALVTGW